MRPSVIRLPFRFAIPVVLLLLSACAPAPIYKPAADTIDATPTQVARTPESFSQAHVIWGGRVVEVSNFADHSEIQLLSYPLDSSQRPQANDTGSGRFIAMVPGYVERLNYPPGALMTVTGRLAGTRAGKVGEADYMFPLVEVSDSHVWTAEEMRSKWSNVHFGVGVGVH